MAQQQPQQPIAIPDDPQFTLQQHILFKRKQQCLNAQLRRLLQQGVSQFRPTMDATTYAYTKLALNNKGLTAVSQTITQYPHLRHIEMNSNQLVDTIHLQKLQYLVHLDLSRNLISQNRFLSNPGTFPYLATLTLANNKITTLPPVLLKNLVRLNLNHNHIVSLQDFDGHDTIQIIQLRGNKLTSLNGLAKCKNLKELYLAQNQLTSLNGLANLPLLVRLHVRKNKLPNFLQFPALPSLNYLNARQNLLTKIQQLTAIVPRVKILNLLANPLSEQLGDNAKKEIYMRYRNYEKINKGEVTGEEKEEFAKEWKERLAEIERQEKEAREQAEREAAQAAAAAAQKE